MIVQVEPTSAVPVFEQLRAQIERLIVSGQLAAGSKLPPIRHLATDLGIARGTVNKVYDLLARDGLVETAGRHGTVVLERPAARTPSADDLRAAAEAFALVTLQHGVDGTAARRELDSALERLGGGYRRATSGA